MLNGPSAEAQIILNPSSGVHVVVLFDVNNNPILPPTNVISDPALLVAFGADFVEVEVPYSVLTSIFPDLLLPDQRSWVRGGVGSLSGAGALLDLGPGASSYRLLPTPYDLDPPLTATPKTPLNLSLPLDGQWLISQGAFGDFTHGTYWAYDIIQVDSSFLFSSPSGSLNNADYFGFGAPILAPADGVVIDAIGSNPDVTPGTAIPAPFNIVEISVGSGLTVAMLHARQNSVLVSVSDNVVEGQQVAEVGNSGFSTGPLSISKSMRWAAR